MHPPRKADAGLAFSYAATVLLSAFLLFQVQPLISKSILPWFGGSPAVWTTCVLFFQAVLFGGYAYAHISERIGSRSVRLLVHLAILVAGCLMLPITPSADWKPLHGEEPTKRILLLLGATVGFQYFALSSTGPLVQAWFAKSFPGRSPYRLYSLSNIGSFTALLSYPFLFEPRLEVSSQGLLWSGGFVAFALMSGVCAVRRMRVEEPSGSELVEADAPSVVAPAHPLGWQRGLWVALPAFASLSLLATTNHVCANVAVIPFLWVVPLSLYLVSFIICFDHERWYHRGTWCGATAVLTLAAALLPELSWDAPFLVELIVLFGAMFGICMVCHGELVRLRPDPAHLTSYYLMISAGGAIGGLFVSLLAPHLFDSFAEWPIALIGGYVVALLAMLAGARRTTPVWNARCTLVALPAVLGLLLMTGAFLKDDVPMLVQDRNFYGETSVLERDADDPQQHSFVLYSGSVIHGIQYMHPTRRTTPTTYYSMQSGVGRAIAASRERKGLKAGVVGLGSGTLAAYIRSTDEFCFYEINPDMIRCAESIFAFLKDAPGKHHVVPGDARLSLEQQKPQGFDLLILDAFSGDAVPAHLLTAEALAVYQRHLASNGALCIHVTNSYLDLGPVVRGLARHGEFQVVRIETDGDKAHGIYHADWMILTKSDELVRKLTAGPTVEEPPDAPALLWTDNFSDLFRILR